MLLIGTNNVLLLYSWREMQFNRERKRNMEPRGHTQGLQDGITFCQLHVWS